MSFRTSDLHFILMTWHRCSVSQFIKPWLVAFKWFFSYARHRLISSEFKITHGCVINPLVNKATWESKLPVRKMILHLFGRYCPESLTLSPINDCWEPLSSSPARNINKGCGSRKTCGFLVEIKDTPPPRWREKKGLRKIASVLNVGRSNDQQSGPEAEQDKKKATQISDGLVSTQGKTNNKERKFHRLDSLIRKQADKAEHLQDLHW